MKTVILAAGIGSRLGKNNPKPLAQLYKDKTILDFQVEKIARKVGIHNIVVVVGYKKEMIMERYPQLLYVYNPAFKQTNTAKSLLLALEKIEEDVLWLNGDVYFDESLLDLLLTSKYSSCLVNIEECGEEEIKYSTDDKGFIQQLSKQVENAKGEAVGINLVKKGDLNNFKRELDAVEENAYFEKALENLTLAKKLQLKPVDMGNYYCKEIDFPEDLVAVQQFINRNV